MQMDASCCRITRPHCPANVTPSVFDPIPCCDDQCENSPSRARSTTLSFVIVIICHIQIRLCSFVSLSAEHNAGLISSRRSSPRSSTVNHTWSVLFRVSDSPSAPHCKHGQGPAINKQTNKITNRASLILSLGDRRSASVHGQHGNMVQWEQVWMNYSNEIILTTFWNVSTGLIATE